MAEHMHSNAGGKQPISQHPLFPAIVALWFGALFGIGSIAIRPELVESVVVASGIDRIVPMAAPPLGVTMRILLALGMTGLGGVIGVLIARRIAAPASTQPARRRSLIDNGTEEDVAVDLPLPVAPAAAPVVDLDDAEPLASEAPAAQPEAHPGMPLGRRRGLTARETPPVEVEEITPDAPEPTIFSVSEFDLEGYENPDVTAAIRPEETSEREEVADDLQIGAGSFAEPATFAPFSLEEEEAPFAAPQSTPSPFFVAARDALEAHADDISVQAFGASELPPSDTGSLEPASHDETAAFGAHFEPSGIDDEDDDLPAPSPLAAWQRQPESLAQGHVSQGTSQTGEALNNRLFETYSRTLGDQPEADCAPTPRPGFEALPRLGSIADEQRFDSDDSEPVYDSTDEHDDSYSEEGLAPFTAPEAVDESVEEPDSAPIAASEAGPAHASAAERIGGADLDDLSQVQLLERLALAMAQRREDARREEARRDEAQREDWRRAASAPVLHEVPREEDPLSSARDDAQVPETGEALEHEESEAFAQPAKWPADAEAQHGETEASEASWPADESAAPYVPAALRPVSFDDDIEDDSLSGYIPPRHIGAGSFYPVEDEADDTQAPRQFDAPPAAEPAPGSFSANFTPLDRYEDTDEGEEEGEEEEILEHGYSSLLNLSRSPAPQRLESFARIEDPEDDGEIQPVVIFPGEEASHDPAPFAAPEGSDEAQAGHSSAPSSDERLFDGPSGNDPAETERALRAALATLQRMSGAA